MLHLCEKDPTLTQEIFREMEMVGENELENDGPNNNFTELQDLVN